MPPIFLYIGILLIPLLHYFFPVTRIISGNYTLIGIAIIAVGAIIDSLAWLEFRKKTTMNPFKKPNKLVIKGIYKFSRNPQYLGMFFILLGEALCFGSLSVLIIPKIFAIIMDRAYIPMEERNMKKAFGKRFLEYKKKVRRWI